MRRHVINIPLQKTLGEALEDLHTAGVRTGTVEKNGKVVGHLALESVEPTLEFPEPREDDLAAELKLAKKIQQQLLPKALPVIPGLKVYGTMRSARAVGGDYWSVKYYRADDCVTVKLADVTGHGIAAALLVPAVKYISGGFYRGAPNPRWVMNRTNHVLVKETPAELMVSMVYGWYHPISRSLVVVNAGHKPAFLVQAGKIVEIPTTGPVLGLIEVEYESQSYEMNPGDLLFACSDGITEAGIGVNRYGEDRVKELVLRHHTEPVSVIAATLLKDCAAFAGPPQDDRSVLLARAEAPESSS